MYLLGLNRRRTKTLLLAMGQLILVAYLFQILAVDHWHVDPGHDVAGVEGSSEHTFHCHGDLSGCADAGADTVSFSSAQGLRLPSQPVAHGMAVDLSIPYDYEAYLPTILNPPQAA